MPFSILHARVVTRCRLKPNPPDLRMILATRLRRSQCRSSDQPLRRAIRNVSRVQPLIVFCEKAASVRSGTQNPNLVGVIPEPGAALLSLSKDQLGLPAFSTFETRSYPHQSAR